MELNILRAFGPALENLNSGGPELHILSLYHARGR